MKTVFDQIWEQVIDPAIHKEAERRGVDPYLYEEFGQMLTGLDKRAASEIQAAIAGAVAQAMELGFMVGWELSKDPDALIFVEK